MEVGVEGVESEGKGIDVVGGENEIEELVTGEIGVVELELVELEVGEPVDIDGVGGTARDTEGGEIGIVATFEDGTDTATFGEEKGVDGSGFSLVAFEGGAVRDTAAFVGVDGSKRGVDFVLGTFEGGTEGDTVVFVGVGGSDFVLGAFEGGTEGDTPTFGEETEVDGLVLRVIGESFGFELEETAGRGDIEEEDGIGETGAGEMEDCNAGKGANTSLFAGGAIGVNIGAGSCDKTGAGIEVSC